MTPAGGTPAMIDNSMFTAAQRQTLYSDTTCATSYEIAWNSGTFGLDAVLG